MICVSLSTPKSQIDSADTSALDMRQCWVLIQYQCRMPHCVKESGIILLRVRQHHGSPFVPIVTRSRCLSRYRIGASLIGRCLSLMHFFFLSDETEEADLSSPI